MKMNFLLIALLAVWLPIFVELPILAQCKHLGHGNRGQLAQHTITYSHREPSDGMVTMAQQDHRGHSPDFANLVRDVLI